MQEPQTVSDLGPNVPLAHYVVLEHIADGGMGSVYKAFEPALERYVAIKVLRPELAQDPQHVRHFHEEAQAVAALRHSNIVPIYYIGQVNKIAFFSMAFIEGSTLDSWLSAGRHMDANDARWFMNQAVAALEHAAHAGLVHLDIKPSNFLVDANTTLLLADFGLAQHLSKSNEQESRDVLGTPFYVSPEQLRGHPTDLRTDIYSLGLTLYHLMVGDVAYNGATVEEIIQGHLTKRFPMQKAITAGVERCWIDLMHKMSEREPARRFQDYTSLRNALAHIDAFTYDVVEVDPSAGEVEVIRAKPPGDPKFLFGLLKSKNSDWAETGKTVDIHCTRAQVMSALERPIHPLSLDPLAKTMGELCEWAEGDLDDLLDAAKGFPGFRKMVLFMHQFMAHSSSYREVEIERAVRELGLERARCLALFDFLIHYEWKPSGSFDWRPLWQHQIACAFIIDFMYQSLEIKRSGIEFAAGLFHDFGKLVLGELYPYVYFCAIYQSVAKRTLLVKCEEELMETTHAEIGALWMQRHGFPKQLIEVVSTHESWEKSGRRSLLENALHSANLLAHQMALGFSGNGMELPCSWEALPSTRAVWEARRRKDYRWEEFQSDFSALFRSFPNVVGL